MQVFFGPLNRLLEPKVVLPNDGSEICDCWPVLPKRFEWAGVDPKPEKVS